MPSLLEFRSLQTFGTQLELITVNSDSCSRRQEQDDDNDKKTKRRIKKIRIRVRTESDTSQLGQLMLEISKSGRLTGY